jgi:hypothetical protein
MRVTIYAVGIVTRLRAEQLGFSLLQGQLQKFYLRHRVWGHPVSYLLGSGISFPRR